MNDELRGRLVVGPVTRELYGGRVVSFDLVPLHAMVSLSATRPTYQLALPGELIDWDWPQPPEVSR